MIPLNIAFFCPSHRQTLHDRFIEVFNSRREDAAAKQIFEREENVELVGMLDTCVMYDLEEANEKKMIEGLKKFYPTLSRQVSIEQTMMLKCNEWNHVFFFWFPEAPA